MEMLNITPTQKQNSTNNTPKLQSYIFDNIDPSIINGIRRIVLSELPHIAMDHETISNTNTIIEHNTSCLHNEMLINRLSLIPLNNEHKILTIITVWDEEKQQRVSKFKYPDLIPTFTLDVRHNKYLNFKRSNLKVITADDFVCIYSPEKQSTITNLGFNHKNISDNIFALDSITNEHCIFLYLKPSPTNENYQKICLKATPIVGQPKQYASFCQVGTIQYENVQLSEQKQIEKFQAKLHALNKERDSKGMKPMTSEQEKKEKLVFNTLDAQRAFHINKYGEPNRIKLTIQSINDKVPNQILFDAINWFILKLKDLKHVLHHVPYESVHIKDINTDLKIQWLHNSTQMKYACELCIRDETHTIGNLLSTFCKMLYNDDRNNEAEQKPLRKSLDFVSYNMPHPLKNNIHIRMKLNENNVKAVHNILRPEEKPLKNELQQKNKLCSLILIDCIDHIIENYLSQMLDNIKLNDNTISTTKSFSVQN